MWEIVLENKHKPVVWYQMVTSVLFSDCMIKRTCPPDMGAKKGGIRRTILGAHD